MSLFVCENCQAIENTALSGYWFSKRKLCSSCDPKIAKWHGRFPKEQYDPYEHIIVEGFVQKRP